eukprot:203457-Chlamydomonas_euryale.AAC.1
MPPTAAPACAACACRPAGGGRVWKQAAWRRLGAGQQCAMIELRGRAAMGNDRGPRVFPPPALPRQTSTCHTSDPTPT